MDFVVDFGIFLAIGLVTGWLAHALMKGRGFGLPGNLLAGAIGAVAGGYVFRVFAFLGQYVVALAGAFLVLWFSGRMRKNNRTRPK